MNSLPDIWLSRASHMRREYQVYQNTLQPAIRSGCYKMSSDKLKRATFKLHSWISGQFANQSPYFSFELSTLEIDLVHFQEIKEAGRRTSYRKIRSPIYGSSSDYIFARAFFPAFRICGTQSNVCNLLPAIWISQKI